MDVLTFHGLHSKAQVNFFPDIGTSVQNLTLGEINLQQKEGEKVINIVLLKEKNSDRHRMNTAVS